MRIYTDLKVKLSSTQERKEELKNSRFEGVVS